MVEWTRIPLDFGFVWCCCICWKNVKNSHNFLIEENNTKYNTTARKKKKTSWHSKDECFAAAHNIKCVRTSYGTSIWFVFLRLLCIYKCPNACRFFFLLSFQSLLFLSNRIDLKTLDYFTRTSFWTLIFMHRGISYTLLWFFFLPHCWKCTLPLIYNFVIE